MRRIYGVMVTLGCMFCLSMTMTGCSSSKVSRANLVPFTKDLRQKLEKENIDLKQVQFYVDQKLILDRNLGDQKIQVTSGIVKLENGKYINQVIVPAFTPGVCESAEGDKLMISFEKGNNNLPFGPGSGYTFNEYSLYGTEWRNGTTAVTYDSNKFRARCGTCQDVASVTLLVRKSILDKVERKSRTLKGRTVGK
ncbi:hypothetical protein Q4E93_04050 [Flavitalea sp. BT771]|uniref:hypothetical protein n=1 Tax=Flavitalea sp. BT771 TaxID=3063329 RepID=UPI0026E22930|nr:hypothetical protein [Flavitalea sp. BT771]MDO6429740.1 hypothetical protein [Flavitalea sp. BT771]MDV6218132.1 hypothetical protein [Flavitalea sp. BT771]